VIIILEIERTFSGKQFEMPLKTSKSDRESTCVISFFETGKSQPKRIGIKQTLKNEQNLIFSEAKSEIDIFWWILNIKDYLTYRARKSEPIHRKNKSDFVSSMSNFFKCESPHIHSKRQNIRIRFLTFYLVWRQSPIGWQAIVKPSESNWKKTFDKFFSREKYALCKTAEWTKFFISPKYFQFRL
jgi:hypothetical protein